MSSSALQIEGGEARGQSIWDTFATLPGRIADGTTPAIGADHYQRYREDIDLMRRLGVDAYRFSFSWPRIQPTGKGPADPAGLDFYDRLVDGLLEAGIEPTATLLHGDLPSELEADAGWINRATIDHFAQYAALLGERFSDRVAHWIPINEPNVIALVGYGTGRYPPARALGFACLPVAHHLLVAHGRATVALRDAGARSVGCANLHAPIWPASEDAADVGASKWFDSIWNGMCLETMLLGRLPADLAPMLEEFVEEGDLSMIRQPLDFYGVNYYNPLKIGAAAEDAITPFVVQEILGYPTTDLGWPIVPDALREWLVMLRARFRAALPPIVITESGCSDNTPLDADGVVDDQARIDYLDAHLNAVAEAAQRGVDVRGYYAWSLLDGWELIDGYTQRFGLVDVDHETQVRTPKRSFQWYADKIASQSPSLG
ncbi:GH1 family beta-glucosidase [Nocardioides salsibiostraticola]